MTAPSDRPPPPLADLLADLWFPSESEAAWAVLTWETAGDPSPGADLGRSLAQRLGLDPGEAISPLAPEEFLDQIERRCRGYGKAGQAIAQGHRDLLAFCQAHWRDVQILRLGTGTVTVAIAGILPSGEAIALHTQSIET